MHVCVCPRARTDYVLVLCHGLCDLVWRNSAWKSKTVVVVVAAAAAAAVVVAAVATVIVVFVVVVAVAVVAIAVSMYWLFWKSMFLGNLLFFWLIGTKDQEVTWMEIH